MCIDAVLGDQRVPLSVSSFAISRKTRSLVCCMLIGR